EMRVLARGIAEHVFHARGDELLGEALAAGSFDHLEARLRALGGLRVRHRDQRIEHRLRGGRREARARESLEERPPRNRIAEVPRDELSHFASFAYTLPR